MDGYFERDMPGPDLLPLFAEAERLGVGFYLGYAEQTDAGDRYNAAVLVSPRGEVLGKYRKIHLPGFAEPDAAQAFQNLERRYFQPGDLGFSVWKLLGASIGMCICADRRFCETYRALALRGAELVVLGYNTPHHTPGADQIAPHVDMLAEEHNRLAMRAGAYQNGLWVIATAKAGVEEGIAMIGGSCIIAPSGELVAIAASEDDEVITGRIDLDYSRRYRKVFNLMALRRPEAYGDLVRHHDQHDGSTC